MPPTVLVVDDCRMTLAYFTDVLTGIGYDVHATRSVLDANAVLSREPLPDVVLMDVEMPLLQGDAMVSVLKRGPFPLQVPVLLMSGKSGSELEEICRASGADGYLVKPCTPEQIAAAVAAVCRREN